MPLVRRSIVVATTHPVAKYGGIALSVEALNQLRDKLATGQIPMLFDHDVMRPMDGTVIEPRIEADGDEYRLVGEMEIDENDWEFIQRHFERAGVPGGISFGASEPQTRLDGQVTCPP
jgi:hypothetical protein